MLLSFFLFLSFSFFFFFLAQFRILMEYFRLAILFREIILGLRTHADMYTCTRILNNKENNE